MLTVEAAGHILKMESCTEHKTFSAAATMADHLSATEMVVPTAPALGGVAAGPGAAAASVPRRAAARLRVTQLLQCARAQMRRVLRRRRSPAHPGAWPDLRLCAAAMPAVPGLGRELADVRASPRVIAACSPGAREGMIRRHPARRRVVMCRGGPNPRHGYGPASGAGPARSAFTEVGSLRACSQLKPLNVAFYGVRPRGCSEAVVVAAEARGARVATRATAYSLGMLCAVMW